MKAEQATSSEAFKSSSPGHSSPEQRRLRFHRKPEEKPPQLDPLQQLGRWLALGALCFSSPLPPINPCRAFPGWKRHVHFTSYQGWKIPTPVLVFASWGHSWESLPYRTHSLPYRPPMYHYHSREPPSPRSPQPARSKASHP